MTTLPYDPAAERLRRVDSGSGEVAALGSARASRMALAFAYLRARRLLVLIVLLAGALVGSTVALLLPDTYTARATFYSEGKSTPDLSSLGSGMGGLSALVALAGGSSGGSQTGFFVDLLKSQAFFDSLAASNLPLTADGRVLSVKAFVAPKAKNDADRRWKARIGLKKMIEVSTLPAGVVVVRVDARTPIAAAAIANRALDVIDALNLRFRRDQAAARRKFTQAFLGDVEGRLAVSENQLEQFLSGNRSLMSLRSSSQNPTLQRQEDRLRAEVSRLRALKEQLESTIENARLQEFNDAPVVARIDRSPPPEKRSGPPRALIALGTVLLAATLLFWTAFVLAPRRQIS